MSTPGSSGFPRRLRVSEQSPGFLVFWFCLSFLVVVFLPAQVRLGTPLWKVEFVSQVQALVWGAAFLGGALCVAVLAARPGGLSIWSTAATMAFWLGSAFGVLSWQTEVRHSRWISIISAGVAMTLVVLPLLLRRRVRHGVALLGLGVLGLGAYGGFAPGRALPEVERLLLHTAHYPLSVTFQRGLVDSNETRGGAVEANGQGFLLVTAEGEFYRLEWDQERQLSSRELSLAVPFDRAGFQADTLSVRSLTKLRVTDLMIDTAAARAYLVHQFWHADRHCLTLRISTAVLPAPGAAPVPPWETVYETRPCLTMVPGFQDTESGGELYRDRDGSLLLSVGDHGLNGLTTPPALAQLPDGDYGKILRIDSAGRSRIVSRGHRNPQGLVVDRDGRIWNTEHGPQGGDEINQVVEGGNYGWPLVSYGTQYGLGYWPPSRGLANHTRYAEPAQAFVPSVAIASLIEIQGRHFADWRGDLLAGSLRGERLFRIRTREGRIVYVEPFRVRRRVRDLVEGADGRIVIWTDEGDIGVVSIAAGRPDGRTLYAQCAACHGDNLEGTGLGPPLKGILDRRIASVPGFSYSRNLRDLPGLWTASRLDSFLLDPGRFVPGTSMQFDGIPEFSDRRALIEYLRRP